jgi:adenine phosphoribosyltransferase
MTELEARIKNTIRTIADFPIKGIQYKDITTLFLDYELCNDIADFLAEKSRGKVDIVCGVESRGFLFGAQIAQKLGLPFIMVRKAGKLPGETIREDYQLEYGTASIEIHKGFIKEGQRALIHDDLLATGGTANATASLIQKFGAVPSQFSFIVELSYLHGRDRLKPIHDNIVSIVSY